MLTATSTTKQLTITDAPALDPIRVYLENYEPGQGRITISCYGRAWTSAWFSMSGKTIEQFFESCGADYLIGNLTNQLHQGLARNRKSDESYLLRIICAVQEGLRMHREAGVA